MKTKKLISLLLAVIMLFTAVPVSFAAEKESSIEKYKNEMLSIGIPIMSTEEFFKLIDILDTLLGMVSFGRLEIARSNVTIDTVVSQVAEEIALNSGLDFGIIAAALPDINGLARYLGKRFSIDTTAFREARYQKSAEYLEQGADATAAICRAIGSYMSIIEKMEIYTVQTDDPDIYKLMLYLEYADGTSETQDGGITINMKTGECYNERGTGMFGSGYNFNFYEATVYTTVDCWMRNFGFCLFYDIAANLMPISFNYITRRFKFDYQGREWMIQIWKGNYFITNGGEVGIYTRDEGSFGTFYNCASEDEELYMSLQVYQGDNLIVNQKMQRHWWMCGFNISGRKYLPEAFTLKTTIEMRDREMLNAFVQAIERNVMNDVSYTVNGLDVSLVW